MFTRVCGEAITKAKMRKVRNNQCRFVPKRCEV